MTNMRVTNSAITDRFLTNVQRSYRDLSRVQEQISSGLSINRPSDDPLHFAQARLRQVDLDQIEASKRSAQTASGWLAQAETSLSAITDLVHRARELTIQGANSTYNAQQRETIAGEIDQLAAQAKQLMNARSGEAYIFSGTATTTAPYAAGSDAYLGNVNAVNRDMGEQSTIELTVAFSAVGSATPLKLNAQSLVGEGNGAADGRVLDTLQTISTNLRANNIAALGTSDLRSLQANQDAIGSARAAVGAATNRVDMSVARLDQLSFTTTQVLGDLTGTDYTKAIAEFNSQQNAYMAALQSGARLVQNSLMDFIR
jgi:flagellar hook-associated protein 3 FlgL